MAKANDIDGLPPMTRWFNPILLGKLIVRVIVSSVFSQYADRRLLIAALDTVQPDVHRRRADVTGDMKTDDEGAKWIDYVSDLGDGFDATYAVAYHLAQPEIAVGDKHLPRGDILIMGGDQVYPTSSADDYRKKLREPYRLALPDGQAGRNPLVFLVPGNHDWYDGLTSFIAFFCREKPYKLGNWRTRQRRSYFALKLAEDWWLWAIDIALSEDMDQPQADYFVGIAGAMEKNSKIILCTAEPGWYDGERKTNSFRCLDYAAWLIDNAKDNSKPKNLRIIATLSGDTHHYARYETEFATQFITSGGGGAFLHGTQSLRDKISLDWLKFKHSRISLRKCYPSKTESISLLSGNKKFAITNADFSFGLLGPIYWLVVYWLTVRNHIDASLLSFSIIALGFVAYGAHQATESKGKAAAWSFAHAVAHWGAMFVTAYLVCAVAGFDLGEGEFGWRQFFSTAVPGLLSGWLVGGSLYGAFLYVSARWLDLNHNDAFSAMRLNSHRHFLRLRLKGDELTVFPLGLDRVPRRHEWKANPNAAPPNTAGGPSKFLPPDWCQVHLIEEPIVIHAAEVTPIATAVRPGELKTATPGEEPPDT